MPAASAASDRVTLDVRGAVLNCRQRTFGVSLPHPSNPSTPLHSPPLSPEGLSMTKVLRALNFRYNSVLRDRTPLHLRPRARMSRGTGWCWRRWKISKNCRTRCSGATLKKCRARRPSDAKNLVTMVERRCRELPRNGLRRSYRRHRNSG